MKRVRSSSFVSSVPLCRFSATIDFTVIAGIDMVHWLYILKKGGWVNMKRWRRADNNTEMAITVKVVPSAEYQYGIAIF